MGGLQPLGPRLHSARPVSGTSLSMLVPLEGECPPWLRAPSLPLAANLLVQPFLLRRYQYRYLGCQYRYRTLGSASVQAAPLSIEDWADLSCCNSRSMVPTSNTITPDYSMFHSTLILFFLLSPH